MLEEERHLYRFSSFRLDIAERQLSNNGDSVPLTPKAFDVLAVLVERHGHLVEKSELLNLVWSESFVEEANVARIVHTLRKALGEDGNGHQLIETVAKKGYRFVADVSEEKRPDEPEAEKPPAGDAPGVTAAEVPPSRRTDPQNVENEPAPAAGSWLKPTILTAAGLTVFLIFGLFLALREERGAEIEADRNISLAVLPVKPLTPEIRDAPYELGIADSLIHKLSPVKNLIVRPFSATQQYAGTENDPVAIGKEQRVDYVLASGYQLADGKIRITSQLIDVKRGVVEEVFRDEQFLSGIFIVQDAIAANIGQSLMRKLNRSESVPPDSRSTTNEDAFRQYLQGVVLTDKQTRADAEKAVDYLEEAIRLDPGYALAYAALAQAHSVIGMSGGDKSEHYVKSKAAVEKALAIDENLAQAHSQLGELRLNYEWDFDGAEAAHRRALELNPNSAHTRRLYAIYLNSMGRFDEAIAESKTAIDLEPASFLNHRIYGMILYYARRYDEAVVQLTRTVEMDPNFRGAYSFLCGSYRMKGDEAKAFDCFLRSPRRKNETAEKTELWKSIYARSGMRGILRRQVEEAKADEKSSNWERANLYGELGEKEAAFAELEAGLPLRGWGWTVIKINPAYDSLRDDPRFDEMVGRVGLK